MAAEGDRLRGHVRLRAALDRLSVGRTAIWVALAGVCLLAGLAGSFVAAHTIVRNDAAAARRAFHSNADGMEATLRLGIERSHDLAASTFLEAPPPTASQSTLGRRTAPLAAPLDMHLGASTFRAVAASGRPALEVKRPLYERDPSATLLSASARKSVLVGWFKTVVSPQRWLDAALTGHPGYAVRLRVTSARASMLFAGGAAPGSGATLQSGAAALQSTAAGLPRGWSARIAAPAPSADVLSNDDALALLVLGIVASALLAGLVLALATRHPAPVPAAPPAPLPRQDLYDTLTGMPNRLLMTELAERLLARIGRQSGMLAGALLIDVDWFKDVNDKFGPAAGDQVLRTVAQRLEGAVRTGDVVGRLERDRFLVLVECQARGVRLESLAGRAIEALREPLALEGFGPSFCLTASVGIAFGHYTEVEQLVGDAQRALEASKEAGKDRFTLFNANMRSLIEDQGLLETEMNAALAEGQFFLLYEPILDLNTREVLALEALIRWRHPERGVLLAADFMTLAQDTGLAVPIGRWALEEACTRAAAWNVAGHSVPVAIDVSAGQLHRDGFATDVRRALQQSGVDPSLLVLQVAEATVMDDVEGVAARVNEVKQLGVRVAVDDFGNGYAYRSDLQRLALDYLKVDRASLAASDDEDYRSWLLEAILLFARDLSLTVIAKNVTTDEQLASLARMGCTLAQGALLAAPVSVEGVLRLLEPQPPAAWQPAAPTQAG